MRFFTLQAADPQRKLFDDLYRYLVHREGDLAFMGIADFTGFVSTPSNENPEHPNVQLHHLLFPQDDTLLLPAWLYAQGYNKESYEYIKGVNQQGTTLMPLITLLRPKSRGLVRLRSGNVSDRPLIISNYLEHPDDVKTLIEGIR
jgi:choline dehydrogenase-like flavoprotein